MSIYISVVSHHHSTLINQLSCLKSLSEKFKVVIKSNKENDQFDEFVLNQNVHWINKHFDCGFGYNNNIIFRYCQTQLGMTENDYFIVLNPDVDIDAQTIESLIDSMEQDGRLIASINLFKDNDMKIYDNSIRYFPSFSQFVKSFVGLENTAIINKSTINKACFVDWASGSFLALKASHYSRMGGFDEKYFMYCEDIDICYRSNRLKVPVTYYPNFMAIHLAKHANRNILSKHFYWHLTSVFRFLMTKYGLTKPKTSIQH